MIRPVCTFCKNELEQPGALIFGPPPDTELLGDCEVVKQHVCVTCYTQLWPVPRFVEFLGVLSDQLLQLKVDCERVTVDQPVWLMPNIVAQWVSVMRTEIDKALE